LTGVDQSPAVVTALLRIAEIEHSTPADWKDFVKSGSLLLEGDNLYERIAEDKRVTRCKSEQEPGEKGFDNVDYSISMNSHERSDKKLFN
jgi:hypothetical protein